MVEERESFLGIDVGTTAVKAVVVSIKGTIWAEAQVEQTVFHPQPAWSEQSPELWWQSTKTAIAKVIKSVKSTHQRIEICAIGLSGQMHSSVFLDNEKNVIRPAILWNDSRTTNQCHEITNLLGLDTMHRTIGNLALEGFTAPKILWLRENEPENYKNLRTLLLAKDYIRFKLTGELATEPSDASGTILYDVHERDWSKEVTSTLEIDRGILPRVVGSTEISGVVKPSLCEELGLPKGTPVVGGGADNAAGAVGCGVLEEGQLQVSLGTSGTLLAPSRGPQVDENMRLHTFCHSAPDRWYMMGTILSAGDSLRWLKSILGEELTYDTLIGETEALHPGSDGLTFLPYLSGERTPHNDANARGVFFGLHLGHQRGHLVRSVLEGICFALRDSLELVGQAGRASENITAIGGGSRSRLWRQIQADIFNLPVSTISPNGGPAYGASLMAASGSNHISSLEEGVKDWTNIDEVAQPNPEFVPIYDELYNLYKTLYPSMKDRFEKVSSIRGSLSQ